MPSLQSRDEGVKSLFLNAAAFMSMSFMACFASAATQKDSETWSVTSAWVSVLPEKEQTPVLILLNYALRQKVDKELVPNAKDGKGALWVVKVDYVGNFLLSELAKKSPKYKKILDGRAGYMLDFIHGKSNVDVVDAKSRETGQATLAIIKGMPKGELEDIMNKYSTRIEQTRTALIVQAMLGASQ